MLVRRAPSIVLAVLSLGAGGVAGLTTLDGPAAAVALDTSPVVRVLPISVQGVTYDLGYCGNGSLSETNPTVTDVLVMIHGDGRDACSYAKTGMRAAGLANATGRTLVVAPHFAAPEDPEAALPGRLYWNDSGWKSGDPSLTGPYPRAWSMSSFAIADLLVRKAGDRLLYPNVQRIVVAGHSAGGQFVNRYTATTQCRSRRRRG